jgi:hypothetical protein
MRRKSVAGKDGSQSGDAANTGGKVRLRVFRTLTLPGGKQIRVMREDAFQRALHPGKNGIE